LVKDAPVEAENGKRKNVISTKLSTDDGGRWLDNHLLQKNKNVEGRLRAKLKQL
jgi:hypothetical protein